MPHDPLRHGGLPYLSTMPGATARRLSPGRLPNVGPGQHMRMLRTKGNNMKALTVRNPWAWEICAGNKRVENRDWKPTAEPPFQLFIHAGKQYDSGAHYRDRITAEKIGARRFGAIIGFVTVTGWHDGKACADHGYCSPWAMPSKWHWELRLAHFLTPVPCKGALGLWNVPDDLAARLQ